MRRAFVKSIGEIMQKDKKVVLMIGDIGAYLLREVTAKYPDRVFNMGASEAAMMSAASGMALDGWTPFVYTITPFITSRCYDQIRVGVGYHDTNVKIIGVGSGVSYAALGGTHHSLEDIAIMRAIPNMSVLVPSDSTETSEICLTAAKHKGPCYIRLQLNVDPVDVKYSSAFKIGKARIVKRGGDVTLFAVGDMLKEALTTSEMLGEDGVSTTVINVSSIKPLDKKAILKNVEGAKAVFTIEEHNIIGGLGSTISEVIAESNVSNRPLFKIIGVNDTYVDIHGKKSDLLQKFGLDAKGIYKTIKKEMRSL